MTVLKNLPPQAVVPLDAFNLESLRTQAQDSEQTFLHADCANARSKDAVLKRLADDFEFPEYFGANLDALYDYITDLQPEADAQTPGFVIVLDSLPDSRQFNIAERNRLLDVFRDAADYFDDQNVQFRVFFSVADPKKNQA